METNRSACTRRAFVTRSPSGTKKSESRVIIARMFGTALRLSRSCSAIDRTTSFSCSPVLPMAPGSSPPCPGSMATMTSRSMRFLPRDGRSARRLGAFGEGRWRQGRGRRWRSGDGRADRWQRRHALARRQWRHARLADLVDELAERVLHGLGRLLLGEFLVFDEREQRVDPMRGVEVEHEPMLVRLQPVRARRAAARPVASGR